MTELKKMVRSAERVVRAFRGLFSLKDLVEAASDFKDTLKNTLAGKFASNPARVVTLIVTKVQGIQNDLKNLPLAMDVEREKRNRISTLNLLVRYKKVLEEIVELSKNLPMNIVSKIGNILSPMRRKILEATREIERFILEVRTWK